MAKRGPGRPRLGRTIRAGGLRMTPETAALWEGLRRDGESRNDLFERVVQAAAERADKRCQAAALIERAASLSEAAERCQLAALGALER